MGKYIILALILGHGLAHISGFLASFTSVDVGYHTDNAWIFRGDIKLKSDFGKMFGMLWLIVAILFLIAAAGIIFSISWWTNITLAAAIVSLIVIVPFWNTVPPGAKAGAVFDLIILVILNSPWNEKIIFLTQ